MKLLSTVISVIHFPSLEPLYYYCACMSLQDRAALSVERSRHIQLAPSAAKAITESQSEACCPHFCISALKHTSCDPDTKQRPSPMASCREGAAVAEARETTASPRPKWESGTISSSPSPGRSHYSHGDVQPPKGAAPGRAQRGRRSGRGRSGTPYYSAGRVARPLSLQQGSAGQLPCGLSKSEAQTEEAAEKSGLETTQWSALMSNILKSSFPFQGSGAQGKTQNDPTGKGHSTSCNIPEDMDVQVWGRSVTNLYWL
jgi:hypothetical protein